MRHDAALDRFAEETEPADDSLRRVRARLATSLDEAPAPSSAWGPLLGGLALGAAAAALALVLLVPDGGPPSLQLELVSEAGSRTSTPLDGLDLRFEGHGTLTGTDAAPQLLWRSGTLHVDVDPDAGRAVSVTTGEAFIRVLGTAFEVRRDVRGTHVSVERGTVSVICKRGDRGTLSPGQSTFCLPSTAAGMLARSRSLQDAGRPAAEVLAAAADGLGLMPASPVREELRVVRIEVLRDDGRLDEALEEARALTVDADHRADQVRELVIALERASAR
jgi:ferric-dicitrate binding protein FerR (iron transport regulator)